MMDATLRNELETMLNDVIVSDQPVGGGCIADSRVISCRSGHRYFLKQGIGGRLFKCEARSLAELKKSDTIRVPDVIAVSDYYLLLEYIESGGRKSDFFEQFGRQLALMHQTIGEQFGFVEDNYIGASPQYNLAVGDEKHNWGRFYVEKRLKPQFQMAVKNGFADRALLDKFDLMLLKCDRLFEGFVCKPSLLHGDLWSGNFMTGSAGEPVIFDPAVYYGHSETDLAMTLLFGGYPESFYGSYNEISPIDKSFYDRVDIYHLYHILNHLNLFGRGYYPQVMGLIIKYVG